MDEGAIKALLRRLVGEMPGRPGLKVTDRRAVVDDDASTDWGAIEDWVREHGELEEIPPYTRKPRFGQRVERVGDHTPGTMRYIIPEAELGDP